MSRKSSERKGIVMYFDWIRTLEKLSPEAQARFLMFCLKYGAAGELPDLSGLPIEMRIRLETLIEQAIPRLDADGETYKLRILQTKYAKYCRDTKEANEVPMTFEAYLDWAGQMEKQGLFGSPL